MRTFDRVPKSAVSWIRSKPPPCSSSQALLWGEVREVWAGSEGATARGELGDSRKSPAAFNPARLPQKCQRLSSTSPGTTFPAGCAWKSWEEASNAPWRPQRSDRCFKKGSAAFSRSLPGSLRIQGHWGLIPVLPVPWDALTARLETIPVSQKRSSAFGTLTPSCLCSSFAEILAAPAAPRGAHVGIASGAGRPLGCPRGSAQNGGTRNQNTGGILHGAKGSQRHS